MNHRGYFGQVEKKFLKQGIVFKPIKLAIFGMRVEELDAREYVIRYGRKNDDIPVRPLTASSNSTISRKSSSARNNKKSFLLKKIIHKSEDQSSKQGDNEDSHNACLEMNTSRKGTRN